MQRRAARFVKSRYSRYSSVSDMLDVFGVDASFSKTKEARLYSVLQNLLTVSFKGVLVEAYKGTRRKHKMKFRQIGHT